jgi:hypothetical protein
MAETRTYSYAEIQSYLQHRMSPQEMHEFEKALMNDPFLADAMEGFSTSNPTLVDEHLSEIESALTDNRQEAKVVPLAAQKTAWWKVAAIVLVIFSGGAITYSVLNSSSNNKNKKEIASTQKPATIEKDSIRPVDKPLARVEIFSERHTVANQKTGSPIIRNNLNSYIYKREVEVDDKSEEKKEVNVALPDTSLVASSLQLRESSPRFSPRLRSSTAENEFKGKVVDKSGEPLPGASIMISGKAGGISSDANGDFTLKAADSVLDVAVAAIGHETKTTKIRSNSVDNRIMLTEGELSLSEVVVSARANKKNIVPTIRVDSSNYAEPVGGLINYQQYLSKQQEFIKGIASYLGSNHEIIVEFLIRKDGRPTNIKVPDEVDKTTAEKTVEIISNGPLWKSEKKDKKVKVIINF